MLNILEQPWLSTPKSGQLVDLLEAPQSFTWSFPEMYGNHVFKRDAELALKHSPAALKLLRYTDSLVLQRSVVLDCESFQISEGSYFRENMKGFHGALHRLGNNQFKTKVPFNGQYDVTDKPIYSIDTDWPNGFGHILLDSLPRLWALHSAPKDAILVNTLAHQEILRFFLAALDIDPNRLHFLKRPVLTRDFYSADASFNRKEWLHPQFWEIINKIKSFSLRISSIEPKNFPKKLYVSRKNLDTHTLSNEDEIEKIFIDKGFVSIAPEKLPIWDQIALYSQVDEMAGTGGTAMHMALFGKPNLKVLIMSSPNWFYNADTILSQGFPSRLCHVVGYQPDFTYRNQSPWTINKEDVKLGLEKHFGY
ncbi:glycosyltransferase family 61 protein [Acinetobacter sp. MD2]|uniref:glycosyltransferase family 61 protein n=1 Tax=Acinetobacter sp. MD2 TaxID=2600066 RepID=UPI002D1E7566|nr:glycosyltransferase 61 family protein [Acinetobacter sp. MD2]MEB3767532.1 glycosyltransferase family 61 protein [Acinetobacter sp. MD2]